MYSSDKSDLGVLNVTSARPSAALLLVFQLHPRVEISSEILIFSFE